MKARIALPLLVSGILLLTACDSNENGGAGGDVEDGRANIEVSGAISGTYSGTATFAVAPGVGLSMAFSLDNGEGSATIVMVGNPSRTGQIPVTSDESVSERYIILVTLNDVAEQLGEDVGYITLTSGTMTISTANGSRLVGAFSGTGESISGDEQFSVSGEFSATCLFSCF